MRPAPEIEPVSFLSTALTPKNGDFLADLGCGHSNGPNACPLNGTARIGSLPRSPGGRRGRGLPPRAEGLGILSFYCPRRCPARSTHLSGCSLPVGPEGCGAACEFLCFGQG